MTDAHRQAMDLVDEARLLEARVSPEAARQKYEEAAELEEHCADAAGVDEPRSRGILRISAVSIWAQAGRLDHAEALARRYLAEPLLPGFYRELYELLTEIRGRREEARGVAVEPDDRTAELATALRKVEHEQAEGKVRLRPIKTAA